MLRYTTHGFGKCHRIDLPMYNIQLTMKKGTQKMWLHFIHKQLVIFCLFSAAPSKPNLISINHPLQKKLRQKYRRKLRYIDWQEMCISEFEEVCICDPSISLWTCWFPIDFLPSTSSFSSSPSSWRLHALIKVKVRNLRPESQLEATAFCMRLFQSPF